MAEISQTHLLSRFKSLPFLEIFSGRADVTTSFISYHLNLGKIALKNGQVKLLPIWGDKQGE